MSPSQYIKYYGVYPTIKQQTSNSTGNPQIEGQCTSKYGVH